MNQFNPYLPSPNQGRNQTYATPSQNYGDYGYQGPQYTPVSQDVYGPDAWMEPGYHAYHRPPHSSYARAQPNPRAGQDAFDGRMCQMQIARASGAGLVSGGVAGFKAGTSRCPKNPIHGPACVAGATGTGAAIGAWAGGVSALGTAACNNITRSHVDQNGNGYVQYGEQ